MFNARLKHENALMREALAWYADTEHWRSFGFRLNTRTGRVGVASTDPEWSSDATMDRGHRANFVLRLLDTAAGARGRLQPGAVLRRLLRRQPKPIPLQKVTVPACKEQP